MSIDVLLADAGDGYGYYETTSELLATVADSSEVRRAQPSDRERPPMPSHILVQHDPVVGSVIVSPRTDSGDSTSKENGIDPRTSSTAVEAQ
jgi:hypothetical protein